MKPQLRRLPQLAEFHLHLPLRSSPLEPSLIFYRLQHLHLFQICRQQVCGSDKALRRQTLTLPLASPTEDYFFPDDSSSLGSDDEDIAFEWDMAIKHKRNQELRQEKKCEAVFCRGQKNQINVGPRYT